MCLMRAFGGTFYNSGRCSFVDSVGCREKPRAGIIEYVEAYFRSLQNPDIKALSAKKPYTENS